MVELLKNLFASEPFIPHGHCYLWKPELVWLHIASDSLIALAYYSIPITLVYFVRKRQDLPFNWIFLLFGTFIVACGTTHIIEIWTLWHPSYWLSGSIKAITATVSVYTALELVPLVPKALALPSPAQLEATNLELLHQITQRQRAEGALQQAYDELEIKVQERTTELRNAFERLQSEIVERRRSQEMLQLLMDLIPQSIWWKDRDSRFLGCNRNFAQITGVGTPENLIGKTDYDVWTKEEADFFRSVDARVMAQKQAEYSIVEPASQQDGGTVIWLETNKIPLHDEQGRIIGTLGTAQDITERKLAEEALHESEERLRAILDNSPAAVYLKDIQSRFVLINRKCETLFHLRAEQVIGKTDYELFPHEIAKALCENDQWVLETGTPLQVEEDLPQEDGLHTFISLKFPLYNSAGVTYAICGISTDITERKQAEEALRKAKDEMELRVAERTAELVSVNRRLRLELDERKQAEEALENLSRQNELILNSVGEGLCGLDLQGRITFVNPAAAKLLGYQVKKLIGQSIDVIFTHARAGGTTYSLEESPICASLQDGVVHQVIDEVFWRNDGSSFPVEYVSTPILRSQALPENKGEIVGAVIAFKDITERQMVEQMKDEFISVVSHELRTPLTSIHGSLRMLASGLLSAQPQKSQRLLEIAVDSTDRLVRLINDILDVERIESGKVTMAKQTCNAADLITQAVDAMQAMAEKAGVPLSVSTISTQLWVDPDRIIQTLTNLLSNAIKFSPAGASVWLSAKVVSGGTLEQGSRETGENLNLHSPLPLCSSAPLPLCPQSWILFQVKDQGRGIPTDKLETIFERFQQVDASDSRNNDGTGLGLAICRSIVQQHQGRIWVESTLGEGSTFYFTLPIGMNSEVSKTESRKFQSLSFNP